MVQAAKFSGYAKEERRGQVRVLDAIGLSVWQLGQGEHAASNDANTLSASVNRTINSRFPGLDELRRSNPQAAEHIEALEHQLGISGKTIPEPQNTVAAEYPNHKVSLSASGIAFGHDRLLRPGDRVSLGITLFPSRTYLALTAIIVSVGDSSGPIAGGKYAARAVFSGISDQARSMILEHIHYIVSKI